MSYSEKQDDITRDEWMDKLNNVHIQRADMNRLIMNYLVTGDRALFFICRSAECGICRILFLIHGFCSNRGLQRGSREIPDGVGDRAQC